MYSVWEEVKHCVKSVIEQMRSRSGELLCIGITSTGDGTWMLDAERKPIRPGIMWCDGRAQEEVQEMHREGIVKKAYALCGTSVFTGTQAAQLKWLERHEPEHLDRAAIIFHEKDWLLYQFTGEISTDATDECLTMIDLKTQEYDDRLFEIFDIKKHRHKFVPLRKTFENCGMMLPSVARELGLPKPVIVAAGPMDVSAHALGVGALKTGQASSVMGTAGLHQVVMDDTYIDENNMAGMTCCHCEPNRWLRLIAAMIATPNLDWVLSVFGVRKEEGFSYEELEQELCRIPIGSQGLLFHPYIFPGGERGPFVKTTAKGSFTGISQHHTKYHMIRAVYEGVAFSTLDCFKHMPIEPYVVFLSGGGSSSSFWSQIVCDALGKPVVILEGSEYGAKGSALNASVAAGLFADYQEAVSAAIKEKRSHEPDLGNTRRYDEFYELYKMIYLSQMQAWDLRAKLVQQD